MQTIPQPVSTSPVLLRLGTRAPRPVLAMRGREALSRPFAFDALVRADGDDDLGGAVGVKATLLFEATEGRTAPDRWVHGVVTRATVDGGVAARGVRAFRLRIAPRFALGKHRVTSRVFTDRTVPTIAADVLRSAGLACHDRLVRSYVERAYCVQYQESDLAFVRRILAEEGIFFAFDHGREDGDDAVVFLDSAEAYQRLAPAVLHLRQREPGAGRPAKADDISQFRLAQDTAPRAARLRDYDFTRPLLDLAASATSEDESSPRPDRLEIYDHRGEYDGPAIDDPRAAIHLEQHRRDAVLGRGESTARSLAPGQRFRLEAEAASELSGDYAIVGVDHELRAGPSDEGAILYENRFACVPATVAYRPRRPKRRTHQVLESAVVVGRAGDEIHTDVFGRVQVRFHWDVGSADGRSSAWLRVVQPWAGASFGAQFVPRVGTEVMVSFLGGDPDCPVVVGGVYNATHPPPFALPAHKTKSGFVTRTSPGGAGANELSFDDAAGEERVTLRAQRDLETAAGRDASLTVARNATRIVGGSERVEVRGDARGGVGGSSELVVGGSSALKVAGSHAETVGGLLDVTATAGRSLRVLGRDLVEIGDARDESIGGDRTLRITGSSTTTIGTADQKRSHLVHVEGGSTLRASERIEIASDAGIRLVCGQSVLEIGPDRIVVAAPTVEVKAPKARVLVDGDTIKIKAEKRVQTLTAEAITKTDTASIAIKKEVQVDGQKILLNSPALAEDPVVDTTKPPTIIDLVDEAGQPIPNQRYLIVMPDGSERSGFVDDKGHAEIELDDAATLTFPGLLEAETA